jgi:hypothetical protein
MESHGSIGNGYKCKVSLCIISCGRMDQIEYIDVMFKGTCLLDRNKLPVQMQPNEMKYSDCNASVKRNFIS